MTKKLRVWWIPQVPMPAFYVPVDSIEEGAKIMDVLEEYDAFQFDHNVKPDYSNAGGLQEQDEDGNWVDWMDPDTGEEDPHQFLASRNG